MSVFVYPDTKIFVACPAHFATGGPESLHQLAHHFINDLQVETFMLYYGFDSNKFKTPVHPEYEMYNVPYVLEIPPAEDIERNILIVPEILSGLVQLLRYKNIRKGIWFLSVDNYYFSKIANIVVRAPVQDFDITSQQILDQIMARYDYRQDPLLQLANFYLTNTHRGLKWFSGLKPLHYLLGYINIRFLQENSCLNLNEKEDIVVYNPKKGYHFVKHIIELAHDINFIPIENMTREEVISLLKKAKVYIDFGNFPGSERIPREAVILGCCIITGKRGSAAFFEDVPIPDEYKFDDRKENIPKIIEKIKDCFVNFKERYKDFEYYREVNKKGPKKFVEDLKRIFIKIER